MEIVKGILLLLAGVGVFMAGLKIMSDGLERFAGHEMRKLFSKISSNRFSGIGIGALVTGIIQSSSATTVVVVGFVNAGLITLFQATAIIMGANIGTTVTGVLIALKGLGITEFFAALAFVGIILSLFEREKLKRIGEICSGIGLIFVGLDVMDSAMNLEVINNFATQLFVDTSSLPLLPSALLLAVLGAIFTAIIQSSSAATAIVIVLAADGALPVEQALFLVLGTNIGTCVSALIASVGTTINARRAGVIHLMFNVIGSLLFISLLLIPPVNSFMLWLLKTISIEMGMQIAWFHVLFNVICAILFLPFIGFLVKMSEFLVRDSAAIEHSKHLHFVDDRILANPAIAVAQILKEVGNMLVMARQNFELAMKALLEQDLSHADRLAKAEDELNYITKGVTAYLVRLASLQLPLADAALIGSMHHTIGDIERIGDHAENLIEKAQEMSSNGLIFSAVCLEEIKQIHAKITEMFDRSQHAFDNRDTRGLKKVATLEDEIDKMRSQFSANHVDRLNFGTCLVENGAHYNAVLTELERIADHLMNIAFSVEKTRVQAKPPAPRKPHSPASAKA